MGACSDLSTPPGPSCRTCPLYEKGEYVEPTGVYTSRYLVVGEAPGADEAVRGLNFVGASGRVLRALMHATDIDPSDVMFTNTVRCRPPGNRTPVPAEIEACAPLLNEVLERTEARAILAAGRVALDRFVGKDFVATVTGPNGQKACWDMYFYEWGDEISGKAKVGTKRGRFGPPIKVGRNKGLSRLETVDIVLDVPRPKRATGVVAALHPAAVMRGWTELPLLGSALLRLRESATGHPPYRWPKYLTDAREFGRKYTAGGEPDYIAFDIENPPPKYDKITDISFATSSGLVGSFKWNNLFTRRLAQDLLGPGHSWELVAHNSPHDVGMLTKAGIEIDESRVRCTMMATYLDEPDLRKALGHIAPRFILMKPWKHKSDEDMGLYNAVDSDICRILWPQLRGELESKGQMSLYLDAVMPSTRVLRLMTERGIAVDPKRQQDWLHAMEADAAALEEDWNGVVEPITGGKVNPRSVPQLRELLYEHLGLPVLERTGTTKQPSTSVGTLEKLIARFPEATGPIEILLRLRSVQKLISTYAKQLNVGDDGCVHPRYLPDTKDSGTNFGAASGRLAARSPNIQNQPHIARYMYVPHKPGRVIWTRDYSQIEARIVAQRYGEDWLVTGFRDVAGFDQHQAMAERLDEALHLLGVSYAELCAARGMDPRSFGKKIVHGTNYGMGPNMLAEHLGVGRKAARQILQALERAAPSLAVGRVKDAEFAAEHGYIVNEFGRRRNFPGFIEPKAKQKHVRNSAVNFPPQSDVADITLYVMPDLELWCSMNYDKLETMLLTQVHDEFVGECSAHPEAVRMTAHATQTIMEREFPQIAPGWYCPTSFTVGPNWAACKDIEKAAKANGRTAIEEWEAQGCPAWTG